MLLQRYSSRYRQLLGPVQFLKQIKAWWSQIKFLKGKQKMHSLSGCHILCCQLLRVPGINKCEKNYFHCLIILLDLKKDKMLSTSLCAIIFSQSKSIRLKNDSVKDKKKKKFHCSVTAKCNNYWTFSDQHKHLRNFLEMSHLSWVSIYLMWDNSKSHCYYSGCCCYCKAHEQRNGKTQSKSLVLKGLKWYWTMNRPTVLSSINIIISIS